MRHIDALEITIHGNGYPAFHTEIPPSVAKEIQALLKRRINAEKTGSVSARAIFPEIFDATEGPAHILKGARLREGLTQKALAEKLNIRQHHLSEMEHGKRPIGKEMAKKLGTVLRANWRVFI